MQNFEKCKVKGVHLENKTALDILDEHGYRKGILLTSTNAICNIRGKNIVR
jgi:hypothetical protein